ncbi:MAG: hypothetical protein WC554_01015 [Clostridia bacterium]|jgi:hypothetical protein
MTLSEIVAVFDAKQCSNGFLAHCPAHDDNRSSLSISQGNNGNVVIHCFAGCKTEDILAIKGLKIQDLFNKPQNNISPILSAATAKKIIESYDYTDENGKLLYQVCRYEPKNFHQRRPNPNKPGTWLWNMKDQDRVIYCLPDVISAVASNNPVFICEGEKAVNAAKSIGLVATCSPGGAGKWRNQYTKYLKNADCIILPDNDKPGINHAERIAASIKNVAKSVKIVPLPGLPEKGDIYDFIEARDAQEPDAIRNEILNIILEFKPINQPSISTTIEEFYYDKYSKEYLLCNKRKSWLSLSESQFRKELAYRGMRTRTEKCENVSEVDEFIINLRNTRDVDYAGPLAGYNSGLYEMNGYRVLVTESPSIITSGHGEWNTIKSYISGLLRDEQYNQEQYLFGWLKIAYESLVSGIRRPGQTMAICGPHNCGKSLLQLLITAMLGGRSAKPYAYMTEKTDFNGELFTAEHLCIEDEPASTDLRTRRSFGAQIKQIAGCETQRCHGKHKQAITLTPFWRLSISLNDEPENLMVLPPIDNSIEDKIIILKSSNFDMPMPSETNEERTAFWNTLVSELPAFVNFLSQWQIPEEIRSRRYGITHFHHNDILHEIDALSPEFRLLAIIDKDIFGEAIPTTWTGTAEDLETHLTTKGDMQYESRKLLSWSNACGTYLGRLAKKYPLRFAQKRTMKNRIWTIEPATLQADEE